MINDKDINISEKPIAEEKAQASQEPPKQETPQQEPQQQEAPQASLKEVIASKPLRKRLQNHRALRCERFWVETFLPHKSCAGRYGSLSSSCFLSLSTYPTDTISRTISSSWTNCRKNCKTPNTKRCLQAAR